MSGIDVFGRNTRRGSAVNNTSTTMKIKSNGGLELNSKDALSIKLDSNIKNILSVSIGGLFAEKSHLNWEINGNDARPGFTTILGTKTDSDIQFIRNEHEYILFKSNEIMFSKNANMGNRSIINLVEPRNLQDAATKNYVDEKLQVGSDSGLEINDTLSIKLDPVVNNMLKLSSAGLVSCLSGALKIIDNKITGLDFSYPPTNKTQAICWDQLSQCSKLQLRETWGITGNTVDDSSTVLLGTKNNVDIKLIRNNLTFIALKSDEISAHNKVNLNGNKLINLKDPLNEQDAATRKYVDNKKIKSKIGFVPNLYNCSSQGFSVFTNSEDQDHEAWSVFNHSDREWATPGLKTDAFVTIQLPFPVTIHAFALSGRSNCTNDLGEHWYNWRFEASTDNSTWTPLRAATGRYLDSEYHIFNLVLDPVPTRYQYYRFYGENGEGENLGLSYMQIYAVDNLI